MNLPAGQLISPSFCEGQVSAINKTNEYICRGIHHSAVELFLKLEQKSLQTHMMIFLYNSKQP